MTATSGRGIFIFFSFFFAIDLNNRLFLYSIHEDAEDRLQGERGPDGAEDLVDEGGQGDEGDDVGGDDEHELARAEDGVAKEGEEGLLGGPVTVLLEDIGDQGAEPARVGLALLLVPGVIGGGVRLGGIGPGVVGPDGGAGLGPDGDRDGLVLVLVFVGDDDVLLGRLRI